MKVYKGFTASPGLVLGQVSRLDRPPLVFGEGPFHPEQEKQALEDAIKVAQQELDETTGWKNPTSPPLRGSMAAPSPSATPTATPLRTPTPPPTRPRTAPIWCSHWT